MKLKNIFALNVMAATLAACGGGDINLNPSNTVIDSNKTLAQNTPLPVKCSKVFLLQATVLMQQAL
jgi:hypothetical protein